MAVWSLTVKIEIFEFDPTGTNRDNTSRRSTRNSQALNIRRMSFLNYAPQSLVPRSITMRQYRARSNARRLKLDQRLDAYINSSRRLLTFEKEKGHDRILT